VSAIFPRPFATSNLVNAQKINMVKVFSATKAKDRELLGARVSAWIEANPDVEIANTVVTQSSDKAFHCLAITLFAHRDPPASSNL
jgi:hypothetical protein